MSNNLAVDVTQQFRPEFEDAWLIEYQRNQASAKNLCASYPVAGDYREFPLLEKTNSVRKLTKQYEETAPGTFDTGKRRVTTVPFLSSIIFDRKDQKKFGSLESPIGPTMANQRAEIERNLDETIVGVAGTTGGLLGNAIEVDNAGAVSYPVFDSTYTIADDYAHGGGGSSSGMSYSKLVGLKQKLSQYNIRNQDDTASNPSGLALLLTAYQVTDLLNDPKLYNRDNATALLEQVLDGEVKDVQGFTIRVVDDAVLPIDGGGIRSCVAFAKNGVAFGYNEMPNHELDKLPTKTHSIQSTYYFDWGLGRIWDQAVWKVDCLEA